MTLRSRFGSSQLHQRDPRSALFENYNGGASNRTASSSPRPGGYAGGYGYTGGDGSASLGAEKLGYRPATPNSRYVGTLGEIGSKRDADKVVDRGQYSDAVLNELESQNDGQVEGILGKVRQLKDVRHLSAV